MILRKQIYLKDFLKTFNYKINNAGLPGGIKSQDQATISEIPTGAQSRVRGTGRHLACKTGKSLLSLQSISQDDNSPLAGRSLVK